MIDPISVAKHLVTVVEKLWELKEEKEKLDMKTSFTDENLKRKISTLQSFERGLTSGDFENINQADQKMWTEKSKDVDTCAENTLKWIKNRNKSFQKWICSKSQNEDLDDFMKKLESALDDFENFLNNTLKLQEHKTNQENNQYHRKTESHLYKLVEHFTGQGKRQSDDLNQLCSAIKNEYLKNNRIRRLINPKNSVSIEDSYINLAIVKNKGQEKEQGQNAEQNPESNTGKDLKKRGARQVKEQILGTYEQIYGTKTLIDVEKIFEECNGGVKKALILGRAGIGKSIFCQHVTYRWAKQEIWKEFTMVVLIRLRLLTENLLFQSNDSFVDLLAKIYPAAKSLNQLQKEKFQELCDKGQVLWILDGYDEFVDHIPQGFQRLFKSLTENQPHLLTSRPLSVSTSYKITLEMIGFMDENIEKFVETFFDTNIDKSGNNDSKVDEILSSIRGNPTIWGIAHIPVSLELICSLFQNETTSDADLSTITNLYDEMITWLCQRYLNKRNQVEDQSPNESEVLSKCESQLRIMRWLGYTAMEENKIIITPELIKKYNDKIQSNARDMNKVVEFGIIHIFGDPSGVQAVKDETQYQFVHLSFQEFFAA
ncbi:unnamed protein product [Rotaria socialis]|uniref:NACHT domain-containing protein n=1 Tax=Rotaria socialis TaxID=392032 RepID=A0A820KVL1_9BILA|nr:unnamed protein product [Rotaria socialis]CAF4349089.1 unnamed protein product [Rotaria socialis]CAF4445013.1 unnamed protein product [Rotaria socialis]